VFYIPTGTLNGLGCMWYPLTEVIHVFHDQQLPEVMVKCDLYASKSIVAVNTGIVYNDHYLKIIHNPSRNFPLYSSLQQQQKLVLHMH